MIKGLELFKNHFSEYSDNYILIGGAACSLLMEDVALEFRATKDLDIVLYIEGLTEDFLLAFWEFIKLGGYKNRQKSTGKEVFYRFHSPEDSNFPFMLELFSRASIHLHDDAHLTPVFVNDAVSSLSAILMDDDYYYFMHSGKALVKGLPIIEASHLIPLKARAWIDLVNRKQLGLHVDEKDIRKHKNDVFRLYQLLSPSIQINLPSMIKKDMNYFITQMEKGKSVHFKSIVSKSSSFEEVFHNLRQIYFM
ncbi:MAG: hypothetical protein Tsb0021_10210 [Chlamydiales bacterium]